MSPRWAMHVFGAACVLLSVLSGTSLAQTGCTLTVVDNFEGVGTPARTVITADCQAECLSDPTCLAATYTLPACHMYTDNRTSVALYQSTFMWKTCPSATTTTTTTAAPTTTTTSTTTTTPTTTTTTPTTTTTTPTTTTETGCTLTVVDNFEGVGTPARTVITADCQAECLQDPTCLAATYTLPACHMYTSNRTSVALYQSTFMWKTCPSATSTTTTTAPTTTTTSTTTTTPTTTTTTPTTTTTTPTTTTTTPTTTTVQVAPGQGQPEDEVDDPCVPNPCSNKGMCTSSGADVTCACAPGFSGDTCTDVAPPAACSTTSNSNSRWVQYLSNKAARYCGYGAKCLSGLWCRCPSGTTGDPKSLCVSDDTTVSKLTRLVAKGEALPCAYRLAHFLARDISATNPDTYCQVTVAAANSQQTGKVQDVKVTVSKVTRADPNNPITVDPATAYYARLEDTAACPQWKADGPAQSHVQIFAVTQLGTAFLAIPQCHVNITVSRLGSLNNPNLNVYVYTKPGNSIWEGADFPENLWSSALQRREEQKQDVKDEDYTKDEDEDDENDTKDQDEDDENNTKDQDKQDAKNKRKQERLDAKNKRKQERQDAKNEESQDQDDDEEGKETRRRRHSYSYSYSSSSSSSSSSWSTGGNQDAWNDVLQQYISGNPETIPGVNSDYCVDAAEQLKQPKLCSDDQREKEMATCNALKYYQTKAVTYQCLPSGFPVDDLYTQCLQDVCKATNEDPLSSLCQSLDSYTSPTYRIRYLCTWFAKKLNC